MTSSSGPGTIVIVRHGATEWSIAGRHTGRTDLPLLPIGEAEAGGARSAMYSQLGDQRPSTTYCSPLRRARRTAEILLGTGDQVVDDRLAEVDYGRFEGLLGSQIQELVPGWQLWSHGAPGGESVEQIADRCDSFIAELDSAHGTDETVVVVSHGHLSRALVCRLFGWPLSHAHHLRNATASVSTVRARNGERFLDAWNVRPHLI